MFFKEAESSNNSFTLLILLVIIIVLYVFRGHIANSVSGIFEDLVTGQPRFESSEYGPAAQDSLRSELHGLWNVSDTAETGYTYTEHLEIQENGLIYRHTHEGYPLPSGKDTLRLEWMREELLTPLHPSSDTDDIHICDIAIVTEGYIYGDDTCLYSEPEGFREGIVRNIAEDTISFQGRKYTPYEGELKQFFPSGAYAIISKTDNYPRCISSFNPLDNIRYSLIESTENAAPDLTNRELLANYYIPYLLNPEVLKLDDYYTDTTEFTLRVEVDETGSTKFLDMEGPLGRSRNNQISLIEEIEKWKLRPNDSGVFEFEKEYR
ncbi:MAG: hypothetical protein ACQEQ4_03105 [Fibrobacterota bacterium]